MVILYNKGFIKPNSSKQFNTKGFKSSNKRKTKSKLFSNRSITSQLTPSNRQFLKSLGFKVK